MEFADRCLGLGAATRQESEEWLRRVLASPVPYVMLSMSAVGHNIELVFGLQRFAAPDGVRTPMDGRIFGFLGDGNRPANSSAAMASPATEDALGQQMVAWVNDEAVVHNWFAGNRSLVPEVDPAAPAGARAIGLPSILPVPNGMVHLFDGEPLHAYDALARVQTFIATMEPVHRQVMNLMERWLLAACHQDLSGRSQMAATWETVAVHDPLLTRWLQAKHDFVVCGYVVGPSRPRAKRPGGQGRLPVL